LAFFLTTMLRSMSLFSIGMLLQFRMRDVGASLFMIGLLSTVRGGIRTLSSPFWGYMSDRLMKRKVFLVSSLALTSSLYPLYIVVENPVRIILIASLIAFVSAGFEPSALAFAGEGRKKAYVGFSIYNSSISLGFLFGRILMGVLLMTFDIKTSMVLFSVIMALAVIPSLQIPENLKTIEKSVNVSRKEVLLKDGLWAMYVGSFLRQMGVSGTLAVIAIYLTEVLEYPKWMVGFVASVNPALQIPSHFLFGRLTEKIGSKYVSFLGMVFSSFVPLLFMMRSKWAPVFAYAFLGMALGAFINGVTNFINKKSPPYMRASLMGLLNSARSLGMSVGPFFAGLLAEKSYFIMFLFMSLIMALGAALVGTVTRE